MEDFFIESESLFPFCGPAAVVADPQREHSTQFPPPAEPNQLGQGCLGKSTPTGVPKAAAKGECPRGR